MTMINIDWSAVDLSGDPRLIVGQRPKPKRLDAQRVDVHADAHAALREIAAAALQQLINTDARPYEPFAELEKDEEHFELDVAPDPARTDETSQLMHLLAIVDELPTSDARDLADRHNLFYALCWRSDDRTTAFVTQTDPMRTVRHGRFFQYRDALRVVETPDFVLRDTTDFVIHIDAAGILNPTPFRRLFTDADVALQQVPTYVSAVRASLASTMSMTDAAAAALESVASRRISLASRLRLLPDRIRQAPVTVDALRTACLRHLGGDSGILSANGDLVFGPDNVLVVVDLLEGRLFEDDFSGQHRRADRFSSR